MLVLSRHRDESIMIGDDVVVTIVDIRGDKVRLGIDAPQDIPVHRQEIYEAIKRENLRAGKLEPEDTKSADSSSNEKPNAYMASESPLTKSLDHYDPFSIEPVKLPGYGRGLMNYLD
jgi:carbon storage regulator|tara:strand:+ start:1377 stop:1727 length:351 start_codon:yes stop_codon:yes gene_type:complete